jgi:UDP-hydrolysing UDP-N-acetyl-D-glucosamine 2-epimerase
MAKPRKIAVVTGSRADYGLLRALLRILQDESAVQLQLVVSGSHLLAGFGNTLAEIECDGYPIAAQVPLTLPDDSAINVARATGVAVAGFAEAFAKLAPEVVVLLGDRYEMLAAGTAALLLNIPAAHIHGGEVTLGAFDEGIRHALTKLSLLHFVAAEPYRKRIIQMGEEPSRVFTVGAPGLDQFAQTRQLARGEIAAILDIPVDRKFLIVTLHPSTARPETDAPTADALLLALQEMTDHALIFTGVNADPGHGAIDKKIRTFVAVEKDRARLFTSLGSENYINALKYAAAVVGNSSSGIVEGPAAGIPTVNIGDRQTGRIRAASVIDCAPEREAVLAALKQAASPAFREKIKNAEPPFGRGGASAKIARILIETDLAPLLPKRFYDLP